MAVLSWPSIEISVNAGIQIKLIPDGARNPRAIAILLIAWFKAPAPMQWISTFSLFSLNKLASAPATELGFDFDPTFNVAIIISPFLFKFMFLILKKKKNLKF